MSIATLTSPHPLHPSDLWNTEHDKMTAITIRQLQYKDQPGWDAYVRGHPEGSFFHLIGWKNLIEKTFGHRSCYLVAEQTSVPVRPDCEPAESQNSIVGILPLFSIKSFLFGKFLISIPFAETGGALADSAGIENLLIRRAIEITKSSDLDCLELRYKDKLLDGLLLKGLYYNFKREIFDNLDQNFEAIPRKARRMIRQGEKFNLSCQWGNHNLRSFYNVLTRNFHNLGTPAFACRFFENICNEFRDNCLILIIQNQDKLPIAGVLTFLYQDQVLPYYAGSLVEYRGLAPNDFMYWQLMKHGCENGYRCFDFGRSKEGTGSFDFKRHWGFEPKPLHYQYYLNRIKEMPNLSPVNPRYRRKIEIWKRLPLWATKVLGPSLSKYLV